MSPGECEGNTHRILLDSAMECGQVGLLFDAHENIVAGVLKFAHAKPGVMPVLLMYSGQRAVIRFSTCWLQSHVLYLFRQVALKRAHRVLQAYGTPSQVLRLSSMEQRPPSQMLRPLAIINRFSTCWLHSHLLYLSRQVALKHAHWVLQSYTVALHHRC